MKKEWLEGQGNGPNHPCDKFLYFDNRCVASVMLHGDWWEVEFNCCEGGEYPDGARFRSRHAAMMYVSKHATVMWIGGRYKGE